MSKITSLDTTEINDFPAFSSVNGKGFKVDSALTDYLAHVYSLTGSFSEQDSSTAHGVLDEIQIQVSGLQSLIHEANSQIDRVIETIKTDIIEEEDSIAASIEEE